jgi:hypothetical protein
MKVEKIHITIGTALAVMSFSAGKIWAVSSWATSIDMRLARIEETLHIKTPERTGSFTVQTAEAGE